MFKFKGYYWVYVEVMLKIEFSFVINWSIISGQKVSSCVGLTKLMCWHCSNRWAKCYILFVFFYHRPCLFNISGEFILFLEESYVIVDKFVNNWSSILLLLSQNSLHSRRYVVKLIFFHIFCTLIHEPLILYFDV